MTVVSMIRSATARALPAAGVLARFAERRAVVAARLFPPVGLR